MNDFAIRIETALVQLGINKYLVNTDCCPTAAVIQLLKVLRRSAKTSNELLLRNTSCQLGISLAILKPNSG
jgi:hypothetical protein